MFAGASLDENSGAFCELKANFFRLILTKAELSALKWEDVHEDHIHICRSEKYNRRKKEYFIDETKNKEVRNFPLSPEIRNVLERVKRAEVRNGYICE